MKNFSNSGLLCVLVLILESISTGHCLGHGGGGGVPTFNFRKMTNEELNARRGYLEGMIYAAEEGSYAQYTDQQRADLQDEFAIVDEIYHHRQLPAQTEDFPHIQRPRFAYIEDLYDQLEYIERLYQHVENLETERIMIKGAESDDIEDVRKHRRDVDEQMSGYDWDKLTTRNQERGHRLQAINHEIARTKAEIHPLMARLRNRRQSHDVQLRRVVDDAFGAGGSAMFGEEELSRSRSFSGPDSNMRRTFSG